MNVTSDYHLAGRDVYGSRSVRGLILRVEESPASSLSQAVTVTSRVPRFAASRLRPEGATTT